MKSHEFKVVTDLYDEFPTDTGEIELKLVKAGVETRWYCSNLLDITDCEEVYNEKGNIRRKVVKVYHRDLGAKLIKGTYKEIRDLLNEEPTAFKGYR